MLLKVEHLQEKNLSIDIVPFANSIESLKYRLSVLKKKTQRQLSLSSDEGVHFILPFIISHKED